MRKARVRQGRGGSRGQALTEFALVLPIFFVLILGTLDVGRVVLANDMVANVAREGARYASVHGATPAGCDGSAQRPCATTPLSKSDIISYTTARAVAAGSSMSVTVCYSAVRVQSTNESCTGNQDQAGAVNSRGALVTVTVTSSVPLVAGMLLGLGTFTVTSASTMMVNN